MNKQEIRERLFRIARRIAEGRLSASAEEVFFTSMNDLGFDSIAMLSLLVAVEDEFGIEWREDLPESVLKSLASIAEHLGDELAVTA